MKSAATLLRPLALALALLCGASLGPTVAASRPAVCGLAREHPGPQDQSLRNFAHDLGLKQVRAFVAIANHLHRTGKLPGCYLTKEAAQAKGWRPGLNLWHVAPGAAIGGDRFFNREHRLPIKYDARYREADLDYAGGKRGAHRLIYVERAEGTWLQWVTVDHYRHFFKLPEAE